MNVIEQIMHATGCTQETAWHFFNVENGNVEAAIADIKAGLKF